MEGISRAGGRGPGPRPVRGGVGRTLMSAAARGSLRISPTDVSALPSGARLHIPRQGRVVPHVGRRVLPGEDAENLRLLGVELQPGSAQGETLVWRPRNTERASGASKRQAVKPQAPPGGWPKAPSSGPTRGWLRRYAPACDRGPQNDIPPIVPRVTSRVTRVGRIETRRIACRVMLKCWHPSSVRIGVNLGPLEFCDCPRCGIRLAMSQL